MHESTQLFSIPVGTLPVRFACFSSMKIIFLITFSFTEWNLHWPSCLSKEKIFLMPGWSLKVSIISGRLVAVKIIHSFRSNVLVTLTKCSLKILDSLL